MASPMSIEELRALCPRGSTVWELLQAVSRSGDTRYVRLFVVAPYDPSAARAGLPQSLIQEITEDAAKRVSADHEPFVQRFRKAGFMLRKDEPDGLSVCLLAAALWGDAGALKVALL